MTEEDHQHQSPIKTPKQLVIVVVLAFLVPVTVIVLISQLVTSGMTGTRDDDAARRARIAPVGTVVLADANAPHVAMSGEAVFGQVCKTCHEAGLAGAPKMGDKAAWAPRIAEGEATLFKHAIDGFQGKTGLMPPKGGNPDLADDDVERAVVYMANNSGGKLAEPKAAPAVAAAPAAAAPAAAPVAAATTAAATNVASAAAPAAAGAQPSAAGGEGKATYESTCHVCHGTGLAGAPKFGDKAAWAPRIAEGVATLHQHALHGYQGKTGVMPPKGGNTALSDAAVQAAVDYMVAAAK